MPFPFVKRSKLDELEKQNIELKQKIAILATKLYAIEAICESHNNKKLYNNEMNKLVKEVVDMI